MILVILNQQRQQPKLLTLHFTLIKNVATPEDPILLLDNAPRQWAHHSCGVFTNPAKHTAFEFEEEDGIISANILQIDSRFVSLIKWLGENHINVRLSGKNLPRRLCSLQNS